MNLEADLKQAIHQLKPHEEVVILFGIEDSESLVTLLGHKSRTVIAIEPDARVLKDVMEIAEVQAASVRGRLFVWNDLHAESVSSFIYKVFHHRELIGPAQVAPIFVSARFCSQHAALVDPLKNRIQKDLKGLPALFGWHEDGLIGLENLVANVSWIRQTPGVDRLKGVMSGKPAVVIATGPSLTKSLTLLKQLEDKVILIAADASLKVLLKAGITPHFVCVIERLEMTMPFFEGLEFPSERRPHLILSPLSNPKVMSLYQGPQWMAYRTYMSHLYFHSFLPRGFLETRHSVSHLCTSLAAHLGCSEVTLVGQDLAFDPETLSSHAAHVAYSEWNQSHTEDSLREKLRKLGDDLYWMAGNQRDRVPTRGLFVVFAREFLSLQEQLKLPIINATEGGLKIQGIEWMPLSHKSKSWSKDQKVWQQIEQIPRRMMGSENLSFEALFPHMDELIASCQKWILKLESSTLPPLIEARAEWGRLRQDHSAQAFGFEMMGRKEVELDVQWFNAFALSSLEDCENIQKNILRDFFEGLRRSLEASLLTLRQLDCDAAHPQKNSAQ